MAPEVVRNGDGPLTLEKRVLAMAQATLEKSRGSRIVTVEEKPDLGYTDVPSPDGKRRFRFFHSGKRIASLLHPTWEDNKFSLMDILRADEGGFDGTPRLWLPAYRYDPSFSQYLLVEYGRDHREGNRRIPKLSDSQTTPSRFTLSVMIKRGMLPSLSSLPEDADIEKTAEALFARVLEGDFSPPGVVEKLPPQIVYDRIKATLETAGLPYPFGRLDIFKPRSELDEDASKILREKGLRGGVIPITVSVGTVVNENGILSISGETRVYSGLFLSRLVFDLSAIVPDPSSSSRKITMEVGRSLGGEVYLVPESSGADGGRIYLSRTASDQEQYPLIAIYEADGETVAKVLPLQLPEKVLKRAMGVVEPVAVVGAATPLTPGATVLSSGRIYPSGEGGINPRKVQQQIHKDRIGAGDIVYEGGGIRRKRGKKRKAQKKKTKAREPKYGGGRRWH